MSFSETSLQFLPVNVLRLPGVQAEHPFPGAGEETVELRSTGQPRAAVPT